MVGCWGAGGGERGGKEGEGKVKVRNQGNDAGESEKKARYNIYR